MRDQPVLFGIQLSRYFGQLSFGSPGQIGGAAL